MDDQRLCQRALEAAQKQGASYADVRLLHQRRQTINMRNGVSQVQHRRDDGVGIRVLANGSWGFAATSQWTDDAVVQAANRAVSLARASSLTAREPVTLAPVEPVVDKWEAKPRIDPFSIKTERKLALLTEVDKSMRSTAGAAVRATAGMLMAHQEEKTFASTEGAFIQQNVTTAGVNVSATAAGSGDVQTRHYPSLSSDYALRGWEFVEESDLVANGKQAAQEAVALTRAPQCPSSDMDLIVDGSLMALQMHETCGHAIELDRVLGTEASMAGTSFLTRDKQNTFEYGSPLVNMVADATIPHAHGSFGYDDEGVPATRSQIVKDGRFVGYLTSRETAPVIGEASNGTMRADNWDRIPLVRMTNVNLEPGDWSLDEMIKDTKRGLYMTDMRDPSIDDRRYNFQFASEVGYLIEDGSLTELVKNPIYTSNTPALWRSCTAVGDKSSWRMVGFPNCGKGEPGQGQRCAHGIAPARFRDVRVGVGSW